MNARRALPLAALAVAAGAAAFAVAALHRPTQRSIRLAGGPVATSRSLAPTEPQFGDTVVATIEVFVDARRVDPRSVQLQARFTPFAVTSSTRSTRRIGGISVVRVVDRLDCLDPGCTPKGEAATFRFPRLRVAYPGGTLTAAWPALRVHARVQAADLEHATLRIGPLQTHSSFRLPPGMTGWTLLAVAFMFALGGLTMLVRAVLPSAAFARRRHGTPLERILHELASSGANGDAGRRRTALEELARELEPLDEPLSFESSVLAWAPQEPERDAIDDLARRVRTAVDR
ncbi:MAG: hypothetical protein ACXWYO_10130 [Gaiellaceae bacterium]